MEIKVGDKVRVSKDAPRVFLKGWNAVVEYRVYAIDGEAAIITYGNQEIAILTKYLIKVNDEAKKPKFKVGQFAMFKGRRVEIIGYSEHYPQMYRVFVLTENYHTDANESDLEPYTEPTEEKTPEPTRKSPSGDFWDAYTADLAKELAIAYGKRGKSPLDAVAAAKEIVKRLKQK